MAAPILGETGDSIAPALSGDGTRIGDESSRAPDDGPTASDAAAYKSSAARKKFIDRKRARSLWLAVGLAVSGPLLAVATYATLSGSDQATLSSAWFKALILLDVCYLVVLAALIGLQIARLWMARRARSAGSRLHGRMVAFFTGVAAAPAILVAIFFFLVIQLGFEAWFSDRVSSVVRNSREVAIAYAEEHRETIASRAAALAAELSLASRTAIGGVQDPRFLAVLDTSAIASGFSDIYLINSSGGIIAKEKNSFLFTYRQPSAADIAAAEGAAPVITEDRSANEMRALVRLEGLFDVYLYVTRPVDGAVLEYLDLTNRGVADYERLQQNRDAWLAQLALLYLGFVVLVLLAAIYLGLWFAERLSRPIGRLAAAAQRVRSGDLVVRVKEDQADDEIGLLSRVFNRMTEEVKRKQDALTGANEESERRRLFSEAVLSGVSAGVLGLDAAGRVRLMNRSAARLLGLRAGEDVGRSFVELAPEFAEIMADAAMDPAIGVERPLRVNRDDKEREFLVRVTTERVDARFDESDAADPFDDGADPEIVGYVVTIDDLTALVSAQKMAAWGDVARRVAHEIKNPLTPIQLAAERLKRKFSDRLGDDAETFERYTDTIVRQTGDIGRMVDSFVRFAKMPQPVMEDADLGALTREVALLQEEARSHIRYRLDLQPTPIRCDRGQITQALTNLLQNAADAIQGRLQQDEATGVEGAPPEIRVTVAAQGALATVSVSDNGVGLPETGRAKLLEPYVTTREKGAGLGLAIVMKILEEHAGELSLTDAAPFAEGASQGAQASFSLPLADRRMAQGPHAAAPDDAATTPEERERTPA